MSDEIDRLRAELAREKELTGELTEQCRRLQEAQGWLITIAAFRAVLLDLDRSLLLIHIRRALYRRRKSLPTNAMLPPELARYINELVTGGAKDEALAEGGTDT